MTPEREQELLAAHQNGRAAAKAGKVSAAQFNALAYDTEAQLIYLAGFHGEKRRQAKVIPARPGTQSNV